METILKGIIEINASQLNQKTKTFLQKQVRPLFKEYVGTGYIYDINDITDEFIGENFPKKEFKSDIQILISLCKKHNCIMIQIDFDF